MHQHVRKWRITVVTTAVSDGGAVYFIFRRLHIIRQLVHIEETGRKLKVIFFISSGSIIAGIKSHTDIKITAPDFTLQGINLYEIVCTEFYIAMDAVQLVWMLCTFT